MNVDIARERMSAANARLIAAEKELAAARRERDAAESLLIATEAADWNGIEW